MNCTIDGCNEPRRVARTGLQHATMCDDHDAMLARIQAELSKRTGASAGATSLLRRVESSDNGLAVLEGEFRSRGWPPYDAAELLRRMEAARNQAARP